MAVAGNAENRVTLKEDESPTTETDEAEANDDDIFASPTFNPFKKGKAKNAYNSGTYFDFVARLFCNNY